MGHAIVKNYEINWEKQRGGEYLTQVGDEVVYFALHLAVEIYLISGIAFLPVFYAGGLLPGRK